MMNSEISTESEALHPWQLFTLAGLIGATVVVFMSRGESAAGVVLLSLTIFSAATVAMATWRTLAPLAGKDAAVTPQIFGGRTRAALEREKALVLRTIKELEFDRAMGKVSDKDFADMSARLRARAARLILQLDAGTGYRETIEREIARRLNAGSKRAGPAKEKNEDGPGAQIRIESHVAQDLKPGVHACGACGTTNDVDARFCKHCGAKLESA